MESLRDTSISQIQSVPGLFISDRFAARSASLLRSLNIAYIISVTRAEDVPKFNSQQLSESDASDARDVFVQKHISIDDDLTEDILVHFKDTCDWIKTSLASAPTNVEGDSPRQAGVLVHCTQGISRSGSIVIAYLMRELSLNYAAALALPGSTIPLEKYAYKAWKYNRDGLIGRGEEAVNRTRVASMTSLAASFGKRRLQSIEKAKSKMGEEEIGDEQSTRSTTP
ncbi:hypothetical protein V502_06247 [Pseudogymnoascus sp. VKM F-4520 (FW-2644)]|nr:hypothetical protein V502_06247 [Pseudogymnoascus sp. VKM F-4520 (FW-2644)]